VKWNVAAFSAVSALTTACSSVPLPSETTLVGNFHPALGVSGAGLLVLKANGEYYELDWLVKTPILDNGSEVATAVDALGPMDRGTWHYLDDALTLRTNVKGHRDRKFAVSEREGSVVITLNGAPQMSYSKPNHSPDPTPAPGMPPARQESRHG
jgi:hypothetical protein